MKSPRDTCRRCGAALPPRERALGQCLRCARQELDGIKRFFRNAIIVGLLLALLVFLLLGRMQVNYAALQLGARTQTMEAIIAFSTTQRVLWGALAFAVPFGYFHQIKTQSARVNERFRAEIITRGGGGTLGIGSLGSEGAGMGLFLLGIITAPVVGPVHAVFQLTRAIRLRRCIAETA